MLKDYLGMNFKTRIKIRMGTGTALIILGFISLIMLYFQRNTLELFQSGFYNGAFAGFMAGGLITLIRNVILLKNEEKYKKAEILEMDERNRFIGSMAWACTAYISFFVLFIALIITALFNEVIFSTLLIVFLGFAAIMLIVRFILKRIY